MKKSKDKIFVHVLSVLGSPADMEKGYALGETTIGLLRSMTFTPSEVKKISKEFCKSNEGYAVRNVEVEISNALLQKQAA